MQRKILWTTYLHLETVFLVKMITKINKRIKELITSIARHAEAELEKAIDGYPELCFFNVKLKDDIAQTPQPPKIEVQKPDDMPPNDNPFLDEPYEIF